MAIKDIHVKQDNGEEKLVGTISENQFRKKIKGSKHIYQKTNSIGVDAEVWNKIVILECEQVVILDVETDILYKGEVSQLNKVKNYKHFKPHRAQVMLPLKHFNRFKRGKRK